MVSNVFFVGCGIQTSLLLFSINIHIREFMVHFINYLIADTHGCNLVKANKPTPEYSGGIIGYCCFVLCLSSKCQ